jgi:hypothetical protein
MVKPLVLIGDIESSRDIKKEVREDLQQKLKNVLERINASGEELISPYTITLGDEFQAVYKKADYVFVHMLQILAELHPVSVRFSLAVGRIDTSINKEQAIGMDGPAFHEARSGIEKLKGNGFLFNIQVEQGANLTLKIINGSFQLMGQQMRSWNKRRLKILAMLKQGKDYKFITKELDISESAFYKNKNAGMLDLINELSENLTKIINQKIER